MEIGESESRRRQALHFGPPAPTKNSGPKLELLFMARQSEANARTWEHGLQKRSKVPPKGSEGQSKGEINNDPRNNRSWPCGTIHRRITGASKDAFLTGLPRRPIHGQLIWENVDIRVLHHSLPTTRRGKEIILVRTEQVIPISRVTFQWSRTPPNKLSGLIFDKRRSQWSPNTSEQSGNTEKAPFADSEDASEYRSTAGADK
ncbi:hypothetical protein CRG98_035971 [Punica granatum]|uniref:Uncharacterized protein n=1 Tax=Punica granatum TaxID=22663 RepID=A0A2I0IJX3_PUNGR|nr:hypothetical protein CRG98_035971 [Punica granatum]